VCASFGVPKKKIRIEKGGEFTWKFVEGSKKKGHKSGQEGWNGGFKSVGGGAEFKHRAGCTAFLWGEEKKSKTVNGEREKK